MILHSFNELKIPYSIIEYFFLSKHFYLFNSYKNVLIWEDLSKQILKCSLSVW